MKSVTARKIELTPISLDTDFPFSVGSISRRKIELTPISPDFS